MMIKSEKKFHGSKGNSKIGKIANINLLCGDGDLGGRVDIKGSCEGCCSSCKKSCYGMKSYRYSTALQAHADNTRYAREDLKGFFKEVKDWVKRRRGELVRFHPHGEIINKRYLNEMIKLAKETPEKTFYVYTKRYDWVVAKKGEIPQNLTILLSPPFTCKTLGDVEKWRKGKEGFPLFVYDDGSDKGIGKMVHCPAVDKNGKKTGITCDKCRRCPDRKESAVYAH